MFYLQIAGWLFCSVYATIPAFWLMIHPFTSYWRAWSRSPYKVLTPAWILMWIIAATLHRSLAFDTALYDVPAHALARDSLLVRHALHLLRRTAHFSINKIIGRHELEPERHSQRLVITGLHARMRHPLYAGHLCTMLGWCFLTSTVATWTLTAFAVLTGILSRPHRRRRARTPLRRRLPRIQTPYSRHRPKTHHVAYRHKLTTTEPSCRAPRA